MPNTTLLFKKRRLDVSKATHESGVEALRRLVRDEGFIVKVSPVNKLSNGVEFCSVVLKGAHGIDYLIQAYGKEALELHKEATVIMQQPIMIIPR